MQGARRVWRGFLPEGRPCAMLALGAAVIALALALGGCGHGLSAAASPATSRSPGAESTRDPSSRGAINPTVCGAQLGFAGYSVTLTADANAAQNMAASLNLGPNDQAVEFLPLTSAAPSLSPDAGAHALALDRMRGVHAQVLGPLDQNAVIAKLQTATDVSAAGPIWLQSSDKRYLACDYKLKDNTTDQALAAVADKALSARGISAATLDDAATMEFVSVRHFNGRLLLQVAFVRRPVGQPNVAYVAILNPGTRAVLAVAQANRYLRG